MKILINVKEEHIDVLHKADIGEMDTTSKKFVVDWSLYSNYVKGFITVQIDYDLYIKLLDVSDDEKDEKGS